MALPISRLPSSPGCSDTEKQTHYCCLFSARFIDTHSCALTCHTSVLKEHPNQIVILISGESVKPYGALFCPHDHGGLGDGAHYGTSVHRGPKSLYHPGFDVRLLGTLHSQMSQDCFASKQRGGPKEGTSGDLQEGEKAAGSQNLQSSKASLVKAPCLQEM